jgi:nucleoid DNA-binding protein
MVAKIEIAGSCRRRSPKTKRKINVKEKKGSFFKVGKELKERVDG